MSENSHQRKDELLMCLASSRVAALEAAGSAQASLLDAAGSIAFPLKTAATATACAGGLLAGFRGYREAKRSVLLQPGISLGKILLVQLALFLLPKISDYMMSQKTQGVISAIAHPRRTLGNRFYRWLGLER